MSSRTYTLSIPESLYKYWVVHETSIWVEESLWLEDVWLWISCRIVQDYPRKRLELLGGH